MKKENKERTFMSKMGDKLKQSPINYFSDLFIVAMVTGWIIILIVMTIMAIYATIVIEDTDIWAYVWELTGIPLTAGGAMWMIKNSVQHSIMNKQGKECPKDFAAVDVDEEEFRIEPMVELSDDDGSDDDDIDEENDENDLG